MNRDAFYAARHAYRLAVREDVAESLADERDANDPHRDRPGRWWPTTRREQAVKAGMDPRDVSAITARPSRDPGRLPMGPRARAIYSSGRIFPSDYMPSRMPIDKRAAVRRALRQAAARFPSPAPPASTDRPAQGAGGVPLCTEKAA